MRAAGHPGRRARLLAGAMCAVSVAAAEPGSPARRAAERERAPGPDEPLATIDQRVITRGEIEEMLRGMTGEYDRKFRRKWRALQARRDFLESQVTQELIAREAGRLGLTSDPEVQRVLRFALVEALARKLAAEQPEPTDAEIQARYDALRADYVKPELRRVAIVSLWPRRRGGKAQARALAERVAEEARQDPADALRFRALVERWTDDPKGRLRGGATPYFARDDQDVAEPVRRAAFAMVQVGEVAVVEDAKGVHVLRLIGNRPASEKPLEAVRERVRRRLLAERRERALRELEARLRREAAVEIHERALRRVRVP